VSESRKHPPRVDDDLERRVEGHLQGSGPGGRAEDFREPEPSIEGEPEVSAVPDGDDVSRSDVPLVMTPRELDARSRFGRYLAMSTFPAKREDLLRNARESKAPEDILADLRRLPEGETFETPARAWAALGRSFDQRF
jgi:Protein of unknown function (DUF2795)